MSGLQLEVASRRKSLERLRLEYGTTEIIDVTSRGPIPWVRFSPFYPHGGIPVPFSPGFESRSVEGIWQALKVFETANVDPSKLTVSTMRGIKRTARTYGRVLGHRAGLAGDNLLPYAAARRAIYLPSYRWVLEHHLQELLSELRQRSTGETVVLLDYETNDDVDDLTRPLSHAGLIKRYLRDDWPT